MDYNISLLDITRDISTYIIHKKEKVDYLSYFFYNILFAETLKEDEIDEFTLNYGFNNEHVYFIATIHCENNSNLDYIRASLAMYLEDKNMHFLTSKLNSYIVILAYSSSEYINKSRKLLKSSFSILTEKFSDFIYMGIGSICSSLIDVRHSYLKSMRSIALCTDEMRIIDYEELGFPRLLLGTIAEEELVEYAKHILGKVKDHDKKFQTDFLKTMKSYILHNGNINKTSAELYIHRNINFSIF